MYNVADKNIFNMNYQDGSIERLITSHTVMRLLDMLTGPRSLGSKGRVVKTGATFVGLDSLTRGFRSCLLYELRRDRIAQEGS